MITDGNSNDPTLSLPESAAKWKAKGIKTYALGFGKKVNEEGKSQMSSHNRSQSVYPCSVYCSLLCSISLLVRS